jgi:hypothetical protein
MKLFRCSCTFIALLWGGGSVGVSVGIGWEVLKALVRGEIPFLDSIPGRRR